LDKLLAAPQPKRTLDGRKGQLHRTPQTAEVNTPNTVLYHSNYRRTPYCANVGFDQQAQQQLRILSQTSSAISRESGHEQHALAVAHHPDLFSDLPQPRTHHRRVSTAPSEVEQ
jgi:hypothetical protein